MLPDFFENKNTDAWFGFLIRKGVRMLDFLLSFAYKDFKYHGFQNMEEFLEESGPRASETFTAIASRQIEGMWHNCLRLK